ncbi:MAG: outer membrane lipoprotein LolB [Candidatus Saccharicenans sp.]|nr:outer membrane lipoprotein LolB [Candidatus Saccharicenans sp.]MDH7493227.1 lipoprotein insertase outer membrane protein LolB [Candidatus Saccharicenans sp.]
MRLVPPERLDYLDGQASFSLQGPEGAARFRLRFYCRLEDQVRLELFDPLGRLQTIVWLNGERATLHLPEDRVFWEDESRVLTSEVFGRELPGRELTRIIAGRWSELAADDGWQFRVDESGKVVSGKRDGLSFEIKETFAPGRVPKTVHFSSPDYSVRMRLLKVNFNRPRPETIFRPSLPAGTRKLEWEEISGRWKK